MPKIRLSNGAGLDLTIEPKQTSALTRYLRNNEFVTLVDGAARLGSLGGTLGAAGVTNLGAGLQVTPALEFGSGASEITIGAGVSASLAIRSTAESAILDPDLFGHTVRVPAGNAYVGFTLDGNIAGQVPGQIADLSVGFKAGASARLETWTLHPLSMQAGAAVRDAVSNFSIPGDSEDLATMPVGSVACLTSTVTLAFSGDFEAATSVNPLALPKLPGVGVLSLTGAASITVSAGFSVTGRYQIRVSKVSPNVVRIGFYRQKKTAFDFSVDLSSGVAFGKKDLIGMLLKAISKDPSLDASLFQEAGLTESQIDQIADALKLGIERSIRTSLEFAFGASDDDEAIFLYEVDLSALDAASSSAVERLLDADPGPIDGLARKQATGVKMISSLTRFTTERKSAIKVNLLGIFNFISVDKLIRETSLLVEPETGEIVITDRATASRIRASSTNFAFADREKLREVMFESVMPTLSIRASKLVDSPVTLTSSHVYFEFHDILKPLGMDELLDGITAVGLMTVEEKRQFAESSTSFKRCTLLMAADYTDSLCREIFLDGGNARPQEYFENAGRRALERLVEANEQPAAVVRIRRIPLQRDEVWSRMKALGQPGFDDIPELSGNSLALEVVKTDYSRLIWWAGSMHDCAQALAGLLAHIDSNGKPLVGNPDFEKLRRRLGATLTKVAAESREHFGDPWGLVAMDDAGKGRAALTASVRTSAGVISKQRETAIAAG